METLLNWITELESDLGISLPPLPLGEARLKMPSTFIVGVFVLGTGVVTFDNFPTGFVSDTIRSNAPTIKWVRPWSAALIISHADPIIDEYQWNISKHDSVYEGSSSGH